MLEAERQCRRVMGYQDLAKLANAVERDLTLPQVNTLLSEEAGTLATA